MIYYIIKWQESDDKFIPIYADENETPDELKDDEFKFVGELNSPEFEKHFNENIVLSHHYYRCYFQIRGGLR